MILILYVDNLLLLGEDLSKIEDVKRQLGKLYHTRDIDTLCRLQKSDFEL